MDYNLLTQETGFHEWSKFEPGDTDYTKYGENNPSIIAAAHKIVDVYYGFANACHDFLSVSYKDYGDLIADTTYGRLHVKTHFLLNVILEYSICLDLSWQVIWAYVQPSSFEYLAKNKYKEMEKECDRDNLLAQLDCLISQNKNLDSPEKVKIENLKKAMTDFDKNENTMKLRSLYNSIKHRGTIHFIGFGNNNKTMKTKLDNRGISILSREEYTIEEIENILFTYHKNFQSYMDKLIAEIIPDDYMNKKVKIIDYANTIIKMDAIQNSGK